MNLHQRLYRLEQHQPEVSEQGLFSDNAELLISVVDQQGNDLYGFLETFNKPYGSTKRPLTRQQLATLKATV
jgi:hypothetical protein